MRERLYDLLVELKTPGEWGHIKSQIGMFSFTGSMSFSPSHTALLGREGEMRVGGARTAERGESQSSALMVQ